MENADCPHGAPLLHLRGQVVHPVRAGHDIVLDQNFREISVSVLQRDAGNALATVGGGHVRYLALHLHQAAAVGIVIHGVLVRGGFRRVVVKRLVQHLVVDDFQDHVAAADFLPPDHLYGCADLDTVLGEGHQGNAAGIVLQVNGLGENVAGMGRSGGRPAPDVEHLPSLAGAHFADGDQFRIRCPLNFQQRFHNSLVSADALPDISRLLHGAVFQEESAADVHLAAARQSFNGEEHRVRAAVLHQPGAVSRVHGAAGALGVGLLLRQGFRQTAARVEHIGGYTARSVVVQTHGCAHGFQQFVHLAGGVPLIRLAAENDRAAVFGKDSDFLHKCLVKRLRRGGYQQDVAVFGQFLLKFLHRNAVLRRNFRQPVQFVGAGVAVGSVHGDVLHLLRDTEAQAQRVLVSSGFPVHAAGGHDPELRHAHIFVGVREGVVQRIHARHFSQVGNSFDQRVISIKRQGFHGKIHRLVIVQRHRQADFLAPDRGGRVRREAPDADVVIPVHPHGRGHGHISIRLGDAEIVVAVSAINGQFQHLRRRSDIGAVNHLSAVGHHFHLADGLVRGVAQENGDFRFLGLGEDAAHDRAVQFIINGKVAVLGGVDPAVFHGGVQRFFRQILRQNHGARIACVAPLPVVVILVVGGRDVPALVQRQIVISAVHHAVFPGHFQQGDCRVIFGTVVVEPLEIPVNVVRVVELADGTGDGGQRLVVIFQRGGHIGKIFLISGLPAGGVECGNMSQLLVLRPGHLKAEKSHEILAGHRSCRFLPRSPVGADARAVPVDFACTGVIEGIAVVGDGEKVQIFHLGRILKRFLHAPCAVGNIGVGVELTEVQIPVKVEFLRKNDLGHFPGLAALGDGVRLEVRRAEALLK